MAVVTLDELEEEQFRRSIETQLRHGQASDAIVRLRRLLAPYAGPGGILPERFLTVTPADLEFTGWEELGTALARHDRPGRPVTALSLAFGWPGEDASPPDADGNLPPYLEVGFYNDETFPFSQSSRDDLLEGYSYHGCTWAGDYLATETPVSLGGIDDLHGALASLEARLLLSDEPDEEMIRAGSLGACLLSVLLFQAVGEQIARDRLPRPLCVTAGSDGVYPYFDAPVVGIPKAAIRAAQALEAQAAIDVGVPGPRFSSLLVTSIPRARKRAVLVLEEGTDEAATRIASLRGQPEPELVSDSVAPSELEPLVAHASEGPLLSKKPPRPPRDLNDVFGLNPSPKPTAPPEPPADLPGIGRDVDAPPTCAPEFQDTQERLQLLVARHLLNDKPAPEPAQPVIAEVPPPPVLGAPLQAPPVQDLPVQDSPVGDWPSQDWPSQDWPDQDWPSAEPLAVDLPAEPGNLVLRFGYDWAEHDALPAKPVPAADPLPLNARPATVLGRLRARLRGWFSWR